MSEESADTFLNRVLDSGINFIDTAPGYGLSEERIGKYIGTRRNEYHLATKCGCVYTLHEDHLEIDHVWKKNVIQRNLETSVKRLRTDFVDVLQFHGGIAETLQRPWCRRGLGLICYPPMRHFRSLKVSYEAKNQTPQMGAKESNENKKKEDD